MSRQLTYVLGVCLCILHLTLFTACNADPKTDTVITTSPANTTVTVGLIGEPDAINPMLSQKSNARTVYRHVFKSMLDNDPQHPNLNYVPVLAKAAPEITNITTGEFAGGKKYTYEIRPEAVWSDGKPILGSDYLFTMKTIFNPKIATQWKSPLSFIKDIQLDPENPKKVSVITGTCEILEEDYLSTAHLYPEHFYDPEGLTKAIEFRDLLDPKKAKALAENENVIKFGEQFSSPKYSMDAAGVMGAGPYELTSFKTKEVVTLTKKKNWWGDQLADKEPIFTANPSQLVYKIVADNVTATTMLKSGELDLRAEIAPEIFYDLTQSEAGKEKLNFQNPDVPVVYFMAMNTARPVLSDKRVRQALTHLIDMDGYIKENMYGYASRINAPFPKNKPFYNKNLTAPNLDLEKANQLLNDAGWVDTNEDGVREKILNGKTMNLEIEIKNRPESKDGNRIAQILQANAKKVGMDINLVIKDKNVIFGKDIPAGDYDIISTGIGFTPAKYVNSMLYFHTDFFPPKGRNYARFGNAKTDALIESIASNCDDQVAQNKAYAEFQEILHEERPLLFLFATQERVAVNKRFDNVVTSAMRPGYFENYFVAKK